MVAAIQVSEALKLMTGRAGELHGSLMQVDVWRNEWRRIKLNAPELDCLTCGQGRYEFLAGDSDELSVVLCGRDAVQVLPRHAARLNLEQLAERLRAVGEVKANSYLVRLRAGEYELTVFEVLKA